MNIPEDLGGPITVSMKNFNDFVLDKKFIVLEWGSRQNPPIMATNKTISTLIKYDFISKELLERLGYMVYEEPEENEYFSDSDEDDESENNIIYYFTR
ncbi:MAG: hypothetical protein JKX76_02535 [Colwellia sp.]|nr:hypothetical protein [Colwellia sp.]